VPGCLGGSSSSGVAGVDMPQPHCTMPAGVTTAWPRHAAWCSRLACVPEQPQCPLVSPPSLLAFMAFKVPTRCSADAEGPLVPTPDCQGPPTHTDGPRNTRAIAQMPVLALL